MMRSMFSGVSGLRIHQTKMDVIANNIANVNTVGFKSARVTFRDAFYQNLQGAAGENPVTGRTGTNPMQIGLGANIASIDSLMTQGLSQRTDVATDTMIQGEGFFIVNDASGTFFTRNGKIDRDVNWNLNINGMALMGWDTIEDAATGQPMINKGPVRPINLGGDKQYVPPAPTTVVDVIANLNHMELPLKPDSGDGNGQYKETSAIMNVYDSVGNKYEVDVVFKYYPNSLGVPTADNDYAKGVWTFEYVLGEDGGVMAYPEGDRQNGKEIGIHVGNTNTFNGENRGDENADDDILTMFSPKGILMFDTEGELVGWNTYDATATVSDGRTVLEQNIMNMDLQYDIATGTISSGEDAEDGWRLMNPEQMQMIITPLQVLDPPATFGDTSAGDSMLVRYPGYEDLPTIDTDPTDPDNSADELMMKTGVVTFNLEKLTAYGGEAEANNIKMNPANGNSAGNLEDISIDASGKIYGRYDNGQTKLLAQIAVAKFQNPAGLERMGNNLFAATANSGQFNGTGEEGDIMSGSLEMSNVDLSLEFTEMITTQRGFQANSRTITVSDEMLQELVNLKR